jgi:hypothetical protein
MPGAPEIGQPSWGEELNACLNWLYAHVEDLEGAPPIPSGMMMSYDFSDETGGGVEPGVNPLIVTPPPSPFPDGEIRLNETDQTQATALYASFITAAGTDASLPLSMPIPGATVMLQQADNVDHYMTALVTGEPISVGDHMEIPISNVALFSEPLTSGVRSGLAVALPAMSEPDPRVDELEVEVAALQAEVALLKHRFSTVGRWQTNTQVGAVPGGMQVTSDTGNFFQATWLRFAKVDQTSTEMSEMLKDATMFIVQHQNDSSMWVHMEATGPVSIQSTYVQIPIRCIGQGKPGQAWQNVVVTMTVILK